MTYEEARHYLDEITAYEAAGDFAPLAAILQGLGNPDCAYQVILVGGTTGKSSTSAYLSNILLAAGYRVGRFSSSTETEYLERYLVNGVPIREAEFAQCLEEIKPHINAYYARHREVPTRFDLETVIAMQFFAKDSCEIVILESGLGNARDSVNAVEHPLMSILTPVCYDKLESLAETPGDIAYNMAGIIHGNHPVILAPQNPEARKAIYAAYVYAERAQMDRGNTDGDSPSSPFRTVDLDAITIFSRDMTEQCFSYRGYELSTSLLGTCQPINAATAVLAAETLQEMGYQITGTHMMEGVARTKLFGRFTVLDGTPPAILDAAQNGLGAAYLADSVRTYYPENRVVMVMGLHRNSPAGDILDYLLPVVNSAYYVSLPNSNRSLPPEVLMQDTSTRGRYARTCYTYAQAVRQACEDAGEDGVVLICGSMTMLESMQEAFEENV